MVSLSTDSEAVTRELIPLSNAKSAVWDYFRFPAANGEFTEKNKKNRTTVFCKLCPKQLRYQGATTNMLVHLQYHHRSQYDLVKSKESPACPSQPRNQESQRHKSITEAFQQTQPLPKNSPRWKTLMNSIRVSLQCSRPCSERETCMPTPRKRQHVSFLGPQS